MFKANTYIQELQETLDSLPMPEIQRVCDLVYDTYQRRRTVFLFGNGGSAALASHMACDLGKGTFAPNHVPLSGLERFRVLSLVDNVPMVSAWANDTNYENIFAEQLANFIQAGDLAFGISGSGNSKNVLKALELAGTVGATTVGLTGLGGGAMKTMVQHAIIVDSDNMQRVEDAHLVVAHIIFLDLQDRICAEAQPAWSSKSGNAE